MDFQNHPMTTEEEEEGGEEDAAVVEIKPLKSILKQRSNKYADGQPSKFKSIRFDEQNIMETFYLAGRDSRNRTVNQPKTVVSDQSATEINLELLAEKLRRAANVQTPFFGIEDDSDDDGLLETEDEKVRRLAFEYRRKQHNNEFMAVGLARKLIIEDLKDISDEEYDVSEIFTVGTDPSIHGGQMEEAEVDMNFDNTSTEGSVFLSCKERAKKKEAEKTFCQTRAELDAPDIIPIEIIIPPGTTQRRSSDDVPPCGPSSSTGPRAQT